MPAPATAAAAAAATVARYPASLRALHWATAAGVATCMGSVSAARRAGADADKAWWMMVHKSTALLVAAAAVPRLLVRLTAPLPGPLPGASRVERAAADASHAALYACTVLMPATGMAMGYLGGKGLPFFGLFTVPGMDKRTDASRAAASAAAAAHTRLGSLLWYAVPLHVAGAAQHAARGHAAVWARMRPWG